MKCTNKQQDTCDVEKRGCKGCYYNEKTSNFVENLTLKLLKRSIKQLDENIKDKE